jgi:uncharacterized protein
VSDFRSGTGADVKKPSLELISATTEITDANRCNYCTAKCCGYITQAIDTPRSIHDFDVLLWQIAHHGVHVFKDSSGWYLLSSTKCQFLTVSHRCGIYDTRPIICREHDNKSCEYDVPIDEGCNLYFQTYQQLDAYCRKRYKSWDKRFAKYAKNQEKALKKNNKKRQKQKSL